MTAHLSCMFYSFFHLFAVFLLRTDSQYDVLPLHLLAFFLKISSLQKSSLLQLVRLRLYSGLLGDDFLLSRQTPGYTHIVFLAITSKAEPWEGNESSVAGERKGEGQRNDHASLQALGTPCQFSETLSNKADMQSEACHAQVVVRATRQE